MEACGAAHHWARVLTGLGHDVKLIAPEAVRLFVKKGKKNDAADAAAICEAASRPDVTFVHGNARMWSRSRWCGRQACHSRSSSLCAR
jgi:transposase